ncbi:hypothetical protein ACSDQ9_04395 [Aestuariimicrobium soli]|uniref:hypothetical protein n=1 Tax=Aestuariimicrobium soli TaxID=2035834 RepID=UPI003EBC19F3
MTSRTELDHLFATQVVVASRECLPRQRRMLSRLLAEGAISRVLPGIYAPTGVAADLHVRCAAVQKWDPDAVISGLAAAKLSFWPEARPRQIEVKSQRKRRGPAWIRVSRASVPDEHVMVREGLRLTRAAWTAVERAAHDNGDAIDNALRQRVVKLPDLRQAWSDHCRRRGNPVRRSVIRDSRDEPWSQGERRLHRELRSSGVKGWVANHWVQLSNGRAALDIAFPALGLYLEFDGFGTHGDRRAFEADRDRQNRIYVELGWTCLRITWAMLEDPAMVIGLIRRAIRRARVTARRARRRHP